MGIDVFFAGLMLLCLYSESDCTAQDLEVPYYGYANTAWVVKAKPSKICGWYSMEDTHLTLKYPTEKFYPPIYNALDCDPVLDDMICTLPEGNICLIPDSAKGSSGASLRSLPRLDEIDRRLIGSNEDNLKNPGYVPTRIHFPGKRFAAGPHWSIGGKPVLWYRSDGNLDEVLPRVLSDRLSVGYGKASKITLTNCATGTKLIELMLKPNVSAEVVLQNYSKDPPEPDSSDEYDALAYLLWYYRLGEWDTYYDECPSYSKDKKDAVVIRCARRRNTDCAYRPTAADTTFWPAMLGPRYRQE